MSAREELKRRMIVQRVLACLAGARERNFAP